MRALLLIVGLAFAASGAVVDRVAITVGHEVITELQLDEELRVTAFLNHQPVVRDLSTRRAAADRLIEQLLIRRDMEVSHYPMPDEKDVNRYDEQIRSGFGGAIQFDKALTEYGLSENVLREHLVLQLTTLRFVEVRFQPEIDISDAEIRTAYESEAANWKSTHSSATPSLEASRDSIRNTLTEQRIDHALDAWLQERRRRGHIVYIDQSLEAQP